MEYVKAAWYDFKHSPNRYSTTLLLALMNLVPILNYFLLGYNYRWGVDLLKGKRETLPTPILNQKTFIFGLFYFVFSIALTILVCVLCCTFIFIFALPILCFVFCMFTEVAVLRASLLNQLEAAFQIKTIWNICKRDFTGLFCAAILPRLIITVIVIVVGLSVMFMTGVTASIFSGPSGSESALFAILSLFVWFVLLLFVLVGGVVANLVSTRATAYWLACHAPEWAQEAAYLALPYQVRQGMQQQAPIVQPNAAPAYAASGVGAQQSPVSAAYGAETGAGPVTPHPVDTAASQPLVDTAASQPAFQPGMNAPQQAPDIQVSSAPTSPSSVDNIKGTGVDGTGQMVNPPTDAPTQPTDTTEAPAATEEQPFSVAHDAASAAQPCVAQDGQDATMQEQGEPSQMQTGALSSDEVPHGLVEETVDSATPTEAADGEVHQVAPSDAPSDIDQQKA